MDGQRNDQHTVYIQCTHWAEEWSTYNVHTMYPLLSLNVTLIAVDYVMFGKHLLWDYTHYGIVYTCTVYWEHTVLCCYLYMFTLSLHVPCMCQLSLLKYVSVIDCYCLFGVCQNNFIENTFYSCKYSNKLNSRNFSRAIMLEYKNKSITQNDWNNIIWYYNTDVLRSYLQNT